jgi:5-methyltetrahydrofolate--homocysteine methyltransferase
VHTALRIEPEYTQGVFWVKDASRAVGVVRQLLEPDSRSALHARTTEECKRLRDRRALGSRREPPVPLEMARANRVAVDWTRGCPPPPRQTGILEFPDYPLKDLAQLIDWTPFFQTWELAGRYPEILQDPVVGEVASSLHHDASVMLERIIHEKWVRAAAVIGLFPAATDGDDVVVFDPGKPGTELARLLFLRQQKAKASGRFNVCLADYIAPLSTGLGDHIGLFAVTAGLGIEEHVAKFEAAHDDYNAILLKALADRLAEAMAERMHQLVRTELWGYAANEQMNLAGLISENYQGIRPAPGYPACPDHSEKGKIFQLLSATDRAGITLTSGWSMRPAASVCGYYFAHPQAKYCVIGPVLPDQLEDYARRKGCSVESLRRLLPSNLQY